MKNTKTALITGATSGIGRATARFFARNGIRLILCGRRGQRLLELQSEFPESEMHLLEFDVRDADAVKNAIAGLPDPFSQIDILINNAGNAHGLDPVQNADPQDWDAMLDINVKGLLNVSNQVIPQMVGRNAGHIINIGSTAAKEVYPGGNVYCASKHAVDAISQGMRMDLNPFGIRVGCIHPGLVETEFSQVRFKGDLDRAAKVYAGFDPLRAEDIAEIIYFVISRPYHVNIADLVVMPTAQASSTLVNRKV